MNRPAPGWGTGSQPAPSPRHPQPGHPGPGFPNMYSQPVPQPVGPPNQIPSIFGLMSEADAGKLKPTSNLKPAKGILKNKNEVSPVAGESDKSAEMTDVQNAEKGNQHFTENRYVGRPFQGGNAEPRDLWKPQTLTQLDSNIFKAPDSRITNKGPSQSKFGRQGMNFETRTEESSQIYGLETNVSSMQQTGSRGQISGRDNKDLHVIDAMEDEFLNMKHGSESFGSNISKLAKESFKGRQYPRGNKNSNMEVSTDSGSLNENDIQRFMQEKNAENEETGFNNNKDIQRNQAVVEYPRQNRGGPMPMNTGDVNVGNINVGRPRPMNSKLPQTSLLGPVALEPNAMYMRGPRPMGVNMNIGGPRPMEGNQMNLGLRGPGPMNVNMNAGGPRSSLNSNFINSGMTGPMNSNNRNLQGCMIGGPMGQPMIGGPGQSMNSGPVGQTMIGFPGQSGVGGLMGQSTVRGSGQSMVGGPGQSVNSGPAGQTMIGFPGQSGDVGPMGQSVVGGPMGQSMVDGQPMVGGPGQPVFLQAVPVSVSMGYGGSSPIGRMSFDSMSEGPGYNDDQDYMEGSRGMSPPPDWQDRRSRSLSPNRYGSPGFRDEEMDSHGRDNDWLEIAIEETKTRLATLQNQSSLPRGSEASGWRDIAIDETRKRLDLLERQSGLSKKSKSDDWRYKAIEETKKRIAMLEKRTAASNRSRSRERSRNRNRGGSADRNRGRRRRSRSRSRGRSGDKKGSNREMKGSSGRSLRRDSKDNSRTIDKAEDPYVEGHKAYLEEQDRVWRDLKRSFKLTDADKPRHPMFQEGVTGGYRCKDCKVTAMEPGAYELHLMSENHLLNVQLRAQELLLNESGDKRSDRSRHSSSRNRGRRSHTLDRAQRGGSLDRVWRGGSRDRIRRSRSRERAREGNVSRERNRRSRSRDRDSRRGDRDSRRVSSRSREKGARKTDVQASAVEERFRLRGPMKATHINPTSVKLTWDSGGKRRKNPNYVLHYRVVIGTGREIWHKVCTVQTREYVVKDLMPETTYQFRVKLMRSDGQSVCEVSEKVKTPRGVQVFIRNLALTVTKDEIRQLLKNFDVKHCKIDGQKFSKFAVVELGTREEAERCVAEFDNKVFQDRTIHVLIDTMLTKSGKRKVLKEQRKARYESENKGTKNESCIENVVWENSEDKTGKNVTETSVEVRFEDNATGENFQENFDGQTEGTFSEAAAENYYDDTMVENFEDEMEDDPHDLAENMEIPTRNPKKSADYKDKKKGNGIETVDLTVEFDNAIDNKKVQKDVQRGSQTSVSNKKDVKEVEQSNQREETIDLTMAFDDGKKNEKAGETMVETSKDDGKKEIDEERKKKAEEWKKREPQVLLYKKLKGLEARPLIGLEYVTEVQDYNPEIPPEYRCELCECLSIHAEGIIPHCSGLRHKFNYFQKEHPNIYSELELMLDNRDKKEMLGNYSKMVQCEKGWGTVKLVLRENPIDFGRIAFSDPILLPPPEFIPPPEPTAEEEQKALLEQEGKIYISCGRIYREFDQLLKEEREKRIRIGENVFTIVGLKYVTEYIHPDLTELPRYRCNICETNAAQKNILPHIYGKNHKLNYLEKEYPDIFKKVDVIGDKKEKWKAVEMHAAEIEKKIGLESVEIVHSKTTTLWDWAKKAEENSKRVTDAVEAAAKEAFKVASETATTSTSNNDPGQFGVNSTELTEELVSTNKDCTNVVEETECLANKERALNRGWNIENAIVQEKLKNGSIVRTNRTAKFETKFETFKDTRTMIGLSWISEFQREDEKYEPYYMCYLCKSKITNKAIIHHVNSVGHRMNYLEKRHPNSEILSRLKTNQVNKAERSATLEKQAEKFAKEDKPGKVEVMLELDVPEGNLNAILGTIEKQAVEKKQAAKQEAEKKRVAKEALDKKKATKAKKKQVEAEKSKGLYSEDMVVCRKCKRSTYKWDPHLTRCCALCCGCSFNHRCDVSKNMYRTRWNLIDRLKSASSNRAGSSSKAQTMVQQRFRNSRKGTSVKDHSGAETRHTDEDYADKSPIERAVSQAYLDGVEPEIPSLLALPVPQRPPRPGTPPPPEVMGSPPPMNDPFIPTMGPAGLMPVNQLVLAPVGLPMNRQYFDVPQPNMEDMIEPLQSGDMGIRIDPMQSGGARGEKRRDFDDRSPDFAKRRRSFSPGRGGFDGERDYGDMERDFGRGGGRFDDDYDEQRQPDSPGRERFYWDNDLSRPSYPDERYGGDRPGSPWEERQFDDRYEQQYRGRSPDRSSDNGYRYLEEEEEFGRRSPTQEEIQELLNQVNSRIPLQGQMLEMGFNSNLPQMVMLGAVDQQVQSIGGSPQREERPRRDSPRRGGDRHSRERDRPNRGGDRPNRVGGRTREGGDRSRNRGPGRGNRNQRNRDRNRDDSRKREGQKSKQMGNRGSRK